jgi:hypothetical protein
VGSILCSVVCLVVDGIDDSLVYHSCIVVLVCFEVFESGDTNAFTALECGTLLQE